MRLTLRTLLAYLDDTLEPLEIKTIGQKVAESETAQELIARIKQVTRRRRITTPPATGPNSFDPNMVADYLDSELSTEQVAELEKICLESDVHLAEVASCHQILTLVLGEPAIVPPIAKERMYGLVQGREAIPFRKAAAAGSHASSPSAADADADEMFLLGLPFYRRGSWLRWALPLAALVLFAIVGVALWQSIPGLIQTSPQPRQVAQGTSAKPEAGENSDKATTKTPEKNAGSENNKTVASPPKAPEEVKSKPVEPKENTPTEDQKPEKVVGPETKLNTQPEASSPSPAAPVAKGRNKPPLADRIKVGNYHISDVAPPSLLVYRESEKSEENWQRVRLGADVFSRDQLVSLPGYLSEVRLSCGIHLLLRGHLPAFTPRDDDPNSKDGTNPMYYLQECAIQLHKPEGVNVDLTLKRGRLYVSNHNPEKSLPQVIRLRFVNNQVWDLTLQPEAEVVVELLKHRSYGAPISTVNLCLLQGTAELTIGHDHHPNLAVPGLAYFMWDTMHPPDSYQGNKIDKKQLDNAVRTLFAKRPLVNSDNARGMERALKSILQWMRFDQSPTVTLLGVLQDKDGRKYPYEHELAIYCLGALDEVNQLFNILNQADLANSPDRLFSIVAVRRWLDRGPEQSQRLFDPSTHKGLLTEFMYTSNEAERIMDLLRDPTADQVFNSKDYYEDMAKDLTSEKVAIAELARWRLQLLAVRMFNLKLPHLSSFSAALPIDKRELAKREVMDQIHDGKLPPPDPRKPTTKPDTRPKK